MFNSIKGIVTAKGLDYIRLENYGIEWDIKTTTVSLSGFPGVDQEAKAFVYLHHKEDQMTLFGFSTVDERTLFLDLISVSGVGPKGALKILSGVSVSRFFEFLETEDVKSLSSLPGLGTKTAQKIILQLKGKLKLETESISAEEQSHKEIIHSLVSMGFEKKQVTKAVAEILKNTEVKKLSGEKQDQEIIRQAIIILST
ncbi:Holliday junction branch migration protein RuvA [Spirochaeta isovalerica]|uniref:Holliday junction branch migration complex subunit RuvA n=1 Tax=Spirochaeta isovalerica TaxID=150 RepID=A0A841R710_9SPIO|nr:Holliday junction branch migration protein RuvA [Spirochaeta isovalerica]MBB6478830.1 Holliday junction DNA helicase RuvA [Spirochaeta isovalerica]